MNHVIFWYVVRTGAMPNFDLFLELWWWFFKWVGDNEIICINYRGIIYTYIYAYAQINFQFILPFVLIAISYIKIWLFLNSRQSMTERKSDIKRKKRLLRMLIVMVVIFAICWFPFNLLLV